MRTDVPGSVHGQLLLWGHPMQWASWGELLHSVRTGTPAFDRLHGMGHWDYLEQDAAAGGCSARPWPRIRVTARFRSRATSQAWTGSSTWEAVTESCWRDPARPSATAWNTRRSRPCRRPGSGVARAAGVDARCELIGADFFVEGVPRGADAYVLSNVLMDWDDGDAARLLRRCRDAMTASSRLVVVERMIPADNTPSLAQLGDLMGLVITGGCMRREEELAALLSAVGLHCARTTLTPSATPSSRRGHERLVDGGLRQVWPPERFASSI
jgi:hypothetical protein